MGDIWQLMLLLPILIWILFIGKIIITDGFNSESLYYLVISMITIAGLLLVATNNDTSIGVTGLILIVAGLVLSLQKIKEKIAPYWFIETVDRATGNKLKYNPWSTKTRKKYKVRTVVDGGHKVEAHMSGLSNNDLPVEIELHLSIEMDDGEREGEITFKEEIELYPLEKLEFHIPVGNVLFS